jgi:chorismate mutase / prephenate dehydratase
MSEPKPKQAFIQTAASPAAAALGAGSLDELRSGIDALDQQLVHMLNQRAALAQAVGEIKKKEGSPFFRPDRAAQVIAKVQGHSAGPLRPEHIGSIWREIMSACLALEARTRVAVLGPAGTFCEQAGIQYFGSNVELVHCANFDEVFHAAESGHAEFGVVGLESSAEGVVTRSLDLLLRTPTKLVGEVSLMVQHNLLRLSDSLEGIEVVLAHAQALAQCQAWLTKHLPNAERRAVSSNAEGARLAATNPGFAGLASTRAAAQFGLHVVSPAVQDDAHNRTRFGVISLPTVMDTPPPTGHDCTSLVVSVPNRPGAVHDLLIPLKTHGVSMTRFESRPARTGQWEYYFYVDVAGHPAEPHLAAALSELEALCAYFKVLGTYAASN